MLFYGISLIMKEKSKASALLAAASSTTFGRDSCYLRPRVARITAAGSRLLSLANDFGLKDSHLNYDRAMPLDGLLPRHR